MDKLLNARKLLSKQILEEYIGTITGSGVDRIVGKAPEEKMLVGQLMSTEDDIDQKVNSSKTFIESIGVDFYIHESEIESAQIIVEAKGDFYYRVLPTLEEQQNAFLEDVNNILGEGTFKSFDEILKKYQDNPEKYSEYKSSLIPVYKKHSLSEKGAVRIALKEELNDRLDYGEVDKTHRINNEISNYLQGIQKHIQNEDDIMKYELHEPIEVKHLKDVSAFNEYIDHYSNKKVEKQNQNWSIYFSIRIKKVEKQYLVSVNLVNNSVVMYSKSHRKKDRNKATIETLFNSGIKITLSGANYCPIELDAFQDDYKYDKRQYALSNNCAVKYDEETNSLRTNHLPLYEQYRLKTNDKLAVKFLDLVEKPVQVLKQILSKMNKECEEWKKYKESISDRLTEAGKRKIEEEVQGFIDEIARFEKGISVIENYPIVKKSFANMNKAFSSSSEKYATWRLFQIVFIVSMIPDIAACDRDLMPNDEKEKTELNSMALLYFPTGGGKTEAFLGVLVFNLFFDRFRGKSTGVTGILRYPLRLLSVQQVQRLSNILASAEIIRQHDKSICNTDMFSLGYYVGDNNTPNSLSQKDYDRYKEMSQERRDEERVIDICPFCRKQTVHIKVDEDRARLIHYCSNSLCKSGGEIPLYIVDEEVYRYLPSAIISTVDKLAIMGCNTNFRNILNGAKCKCPKHGFTSRTKCIEKRCNVEVGDYIEVEQYDPAPTLLIQDELHLIRESLGTYASHYESYLRHYIRTRSESKRDVKVIGATATISSYREQVYHLYGREPIRFPSESPYVDKNFYSYIDKDDLQRQILGYAPYGRAIVNSVVFSLKYMREVIFSYYSNPQKVLDIPDIGIDNIEDAREILKDYWIFIEYNNVKRDGNNVDGALKTPVNEDLKKEGIPPFVTRAMTGDETFKDVREVLAEVENNDSVYDGINLITATSMISHGVDADRFNVMFFYGMPGNMAEYIQAYSRTGRKYSSIVVDLIRPSRETDVSYLKNFVNAHKFKDLLVEPVPINKWASKAIINTLPGVFTSLLFSGYDIQLQYITGSLFFMKNIKKAIKDSLLQKEIVADELYKSYGCTSEDGVIIEIGNQYRDKIKQFVDDVFAQIGDRAWANENVFEGFNMMGYQIMRSLRDTDSTLIIELD